MEIIFTFGSIVAGVVFVGLMGWIVWDAIFGRD